MSKTLKISTAEGMRSSILNQNSARKLELSINLVHGRDPTYRQIGDILYEFHALSKHDGETIVVGDATYEQLMKSINSS